MPSEQQRQYPALERPPIVEVVCGVVFEQIPEIDPLVLGVYWDRIRAEFPNRSLQPALTEDVGFTIGAYPLRARLTSVDEQFAIQLQHDRFFMNWRATGGTYPRFSERHGQVGLLSRALSEYERFSDFIHERTGKRPTATRVELTKIDLLNRGKDWADLDDLAEVMPVTGVFAKIQRSSERDVNLRFVERGTDGVALVHVATLVQGGSPSAIRIEARRIAPVVDDLQSAFAAANQVLNDVFFELIPSAKDLFGIRENV